MCKKTPKYHFIRIFLVPMLLYFLMVMPVSMFLVIKNTPDLIPKNKSSLEKIPKHEIQNIDSLKNNKKSVHFDINLHDKKSKSGESYRLFTLSMFITFILLLGFSIPFKRYFNKVRRKKPIPEKLKYFIRKYILYSPIIISGVLFIIISITHLKALLHLNCSDSFCDPIEKMLFSKLLLISFIASILISILIFKWQNNRVQLKYINHIFTEEELKTRIFKQKPRKILHKFFISSLGNTFLPLLIVIFYLTLSFSNLNDLDIETITTEHEQILIGKYLEIQNYFLVKDYESLNYINAIDTVLLMIGISVSLFVIIIYLLFVTKWTAKSIIYPIKELLKNIQATTNGKIGNYGVVRTNDEIGLLTEGYNKMSETLKANFDEITDMNKNLEKKVIERTAEITQQKEEIESQKDEIETQKDEIEQQRDVAFKQHKDITDSILYAKRIQDAILPSINTFNNIFPNNFIIFKPRDIVSGDFYWLNKINRNNTPYYIIAVADCTGHGVPGAFMSMLGTSLLNEITIRTDIKNAAQLLDVLREKVKQSLSQTGKMDEAKDGMDIAISVINLDNLQLQFAGANNPLYIIRNEKEMEKSQTPKILKSQNPKKLQVIKGDRQPIGIYIKERPFTNHQIQLEKGNQIYMLTDGYVDQIGGPNRKKFMTKNFKKYLLQISNNTMQEQKEILTEKFEEWKGDNMQLDDILMIGIKL